MRSSALLGLLLLGFLLGGALVATAPAQAQTHPVETTLDAFVDSLSRAGHRFSDVRVAIAEGYRKLGPDFPGMGEHWVHPSLVIGGKVDPERPPVIAYTKVEGRRVLLGFAFTRVLGPGERVPGSVFPHGAWHDHSDAVDEEALLLSGPASMHAEGDDFRLSMVHVWTGLENPDGTLAQNNWALPFVRLGLAAPAEVSTSAARALSLATDEGLAFYRTLLREGVGMEGEYVDEVLETFGAAGREAGMWARTHRGLDLSGTEVGALAEVWEQAWMRLEAKLPREVMASILVIRGG